MNIIIPIIDYQKNKKQFIHKITIKITNSFKLEIFLNIFVTEKKVNFIILYHFIIIIKLNCLYL